MMKSLGLLAQFILINIHKNAKCIMIYILYIFDYIMIFVYIMMRFLFYLTTLWRCCFVNISSYTRKAPVMTRAVLDFNFSAAPVNSDPCVVQLMFENTGAVATEW